MNRSLFLVVALLLVSLFLVSCDISSGTIPSQQDLTKLKPGEIVEHPATANNPYYFYTYFPKSALSKKDITLLVWPHGGNMLNNDYNYHKQQAYYTVEMLKSWSEKYKLPILVCALPRPESVEGEDVRELSAHALNRKAFTTNIEFYRRPDLKIIDAIWNQYIPFLRSLGFNVSEKIYMMGFSSAATFTHRFTIIHPDKIKATWIGASTTGPLPSSTYQGITITYPLGVSDLGELAGTPFDWETYKLIPQFMIIGEEDIDAFHDPDALDFFTEEQLEIIKTYFPKERPQRQKFLADYIKNMGGDVTFKMYEGIGHEIPDEMLKDAFDFLISH